MLMTIRKTENGKTTVTTQEVTQDFKRNYCSASALNFLRSLGGTEELIRSGRAVHIYSTSPDNTIHKHVTFE